jgi:hypothetical protein
MSKRNWQSGLIWFQTVEGATVTEIIMLQRVEADLKEVVQGPVDVTGRRRWTAIRRRAWGQGWWQRGSERQRQRKRVRGLRCGSSLRWGPGCRDRDGDGAAARRVKRSVASHAAERNSNKR